MPSDFFETFWLLADYVKIKARGSFYGHVATAEAVDDSPESRRAFAEILGALGGAIAGATLLILKSARMASGSQMLGVTEWEREGPGAIALRGYCLEHGRPQPRRGERFQLVEAPHIPEARVLAFLDVCSRELPAFEEDYYFLEKMDLELFENDFRQLGVWVITDNIGFKEVRKRLFDYRMLFTTGSMEILLWLRRCLEEAGEDLVSLRYAREVMDVVHLNHYLGLVSGDSLDRWREFFGLQPEGNEDDA